MPHRMRKVWVINGWSIYVQVVELLFNFNQSFGQELVDLHTILFMFGKVLVHAWSRRGCLNEEHFILVY